MKIAVINFSGNVGKSTVARHLLLPRIPGAQLISVESINADDGHGGQSLRGRQFADLQEYMQTVEDVVVDVGASNVEEMLSLMRRYQGSHEDFDYFVIPTTPPSKQQQDTIATLIDLSRSGIGASRLKLVFNMVEEHESISQAFKLLLAFLEQHSLASFSQRCRLSANEVYGRMKGMGSEMDLASLASDTTDYKALIAKARSTDEKVALAQALATRRLAGGVVPELDACFAALDLESATA